MTRPYFQVHGANTVSRAKWRRTPVGTRGALLTLWMLSSVRDPEGVWPDRETLEEDLSADAGGADMKQAVDRLIELRWLDCTPDGCIVHDWPDWQPKLAKSNAERQAEWRSAHPNGRNESNGRNDEASLVTLGEERRGDKRKDSLRESRPTPIGRVHEWLKAHNAARATGYVLTDLQALVKGYGPDRVIEALTACDARTTKEYVRMAERSLAAGGPSSGKAKEPPRVSALQAEIRAGIAARYGSDGLTSVGAVLSSGQNGSTGNGRTLTVDSASGGESAAAVPSGTRIGNDPSPGREAEALTPEPNRASLKRVVQEAPTVGAAKEIR